MSKDNRISGISFVKYMVGFSIPTFVGFALSFISTPITTRLFTPDEVGRINLFTTYLTMFAVICYLGLDQAFVRFYHEPPKGNTKESLATVCLYVSLAASVFVSLAILIAVYPISYAISGEYNYVIPICMIISLFGVVVLRYLALISRMRQDAFMYSLQMIIGVVVSRLSYVIVAFWIPNHVFAIVAITVGYFTTTIIFFSILSKSNFTTRAKFNKSTLKPIFKFSLPLIPSSLLSWLNNSVSQLMLKAFVSYSAIGIYSNAVAVANLISLIQTGFNTYWTAFVYENYKSEKGRIKQIHHLISFAMVAMGLLIILGQDIIYLLIGQNFRESKVFFPILLISPIAYTIGETTGLGIAISKKSYYTTVSFIITVAVNIGLCYFLLPQIGIIGAAIASAVAAIVGLVVRTLVGERYYKCIDNYWKMVSGLLIICTAALVNVVLIKYFMLKYSIVLGLMVILFIIYMSQVKYLISFTKAQLKVLFNNRAGRK